jgi:hypothetical protein
MGKGFGSENDGREDELVLKQSPSSLRHLQASKYII